MMYNQISHSGYTPETLPLWRRLAIGVCLIVAVVGVIRLATPSANASAKPDTPHKLTQTIETIRLGQRVVSHNPLRHETHAASAIDPKTWRAVRLHSFQYGVDYDLAFLRSLSWIEVQGAKVGSSINLVMPEIGLDGPAEVLAIDPCPPIDPDDGTGRMVVTGTMAHPAANVLDISIAGESKPMGCTDTHPIWSEDRQAFIHAGELHIGERLQRADGTITQITRITPHTGPPVMTYNLEVDGEHVYRVGDGSLLVHNHGCVPWDPIWETIGEGSAPPANEGIYWFEGASGDLYVGQSGQVPVRTGQHQGTGKLQPGKLGDPNVRRGAWGQGSTRDCRTNQDRQAWRTECDRESEKSYWPQSTASPA